jgi:hypothetical protein
MIDQFTTVNKTYQKHGDGQLAHAVGEASSSVSGLGYNFRGIAVREGGIAANHAREEIMITRTIAVLTGGVLLCFSAGCGVFKSSTTQASVESSSDSSAAGFRSSSSPFEWSSDSSSPSGESPSAYQRDVIDYTAKFAASEGDVQSFQRDVTAIAEGHGITDWEQDDGTYLAIGRGLAKASLSEQRFQQLAVQLSNQNQRQLALLKSGYETYGTP